MSNERTADELKHAKDVREMFSRISPKYDFLNHFLSGNTDKRWRKLVMKKLESVLDDENALVLDVACGTGDLAVELQKNAKAKIIGTDFCRPMLAIAKEKNAPENLFIPYLEADGMNLSFADETFDALTIAFGLRNFSNWQDGLKELHRILKVGGKLVILEFSAPVVPGFRQAFQFYFTKILPKIGGVFSGSRGAYEYLSESVARFPDQKGLMRMMLESGFNNVEYKNLTGGIAAIHLGVKI